MRLPLQLFRRECLRICFHVFRPRSAIRFATGRVAPPSGPCPWQKARSSRRDREDSPRAPERSDGRWPQGRPATNPGQPPSPAETRHAAGRRPAARVPTGARSRISLIPLRCWIQNALVFFKALSNHGENMRGAAGEKAEKVPLPPRIQDATASHASPRRYAPASERDP